MKNIVIRFLSNLKRVKNLILLGIGLLKSTHSYADLGILPDGITYKLRKQEGHVIHIVHINPSLYQMAFVKSHDQVFGRETLPEIALRKDAVVALNAGFFEIGGSEDGRPSGTLIIDGQIFGAKTLPHDVLVKTSQGIDIHRILSLLKVLIHDQEIISLKFNQFSDANHPILYSYQWGPTTLTPYTGRQEFLIDSTYRIIDSKGHGSNEIPTDGFVLSFPSSQSWTSIKIGDSMTLEGLNQDISMVMGIPAIVKEGKMLPQVQEYQTDAFKAPHARTAIGVDAKGNIIVLVAEHAYSQDLKKVTLEQARNIFKDHKIPLNETTLAESRKILEDYLKPKHAAVGLNLKELADLMISLGCRSAINLDGGGSSTLWLKGHVVNFPIGDQDEAIGESKLRPISDALVFLPLPSKEN